MLSLIDELDYLKVITKGKGVPGWLSGLKTVFGALIATRREPLQAMLDGPAEGATLATGLELWGWATSWGAVIERVEVWLGGERLGLAEYGQARPDVVRVRPWLSANCGFVGHFEWQAGPLQAGPQVLLVHIVDSRGRQRDLTRIVEVAPQESSQPVFSYADWIAANEPDETALAAQREAVTGLAMQPLISLITPVYNPPPAVLWAMFKSVQAQTYPRWELCLVDGGSDREGVAETLAEIARLDERVRLQRLESNAGIVGNSNQALQMAQGEFVALLDHDDTLSPDALYEVVAALNARPDLDLLYSDHDLLSEDGRSRHDPLFKPDWSPEIMLSANYITHLTVLRRTLVESVGGFADGTDGAQDWDLFWRVIEQTRPERIAHLPKILYHWRESASSTATDIYRKPQAPINQLKAIEGHLHRQGLAGARAFFEQSGPIRVSWTLPATPPVSIIVPTKDKPELISACVRSVLTRTDYPDFELVIVDTGSSDPAVASLYEMLRTEPRVRLLRDDRQPFNFSAVNNRAAAECRGEILVFLNNDTEVIASDWLTEMVRWAQLPQIGLVGGRLLRRDDTIQHAGVVVGLGGLAGHILAGLPEDSWSLFGSTGWYRDYLAVSAACLAVRRSVFDELKGFDETFQLNGSDVDLGLKANAAGYRVVYNPFVRLYHLESATYGGRNVPPGDYARSYQLYRPWLEAGDPYFSPHLSNLSTIPVLRPPDEPTRQALAERYLGAAEPV